MAVHFTYKETVEAPDLCQGDILYRTQELDEVLAAYYPSYAKNDSNKYFIVLTQSCELVRRDGKSCDARYIALAPARPLTVALSRKLAELSEDSLGADAAICTERNKNRLSMWLERLLNNNEPEYFFLRRAPDRRLAEDCCAFLALSIAIKSDLRYELCLNARILALTESFQAKLGWLVGQMYSRIGTDDWPKEDLKGTIKSALEGVAVWVPDRKLGALRKKVKQWQQENPEGSLDDSVVSAILKNVPGRKDQVVERLVQLLKDKSLVNEADTLRLRNAINGDPELSSLLKE